MDTRAAEKPKRLVMHRFIARYPAGHELEGQHVESIAFCRRARKDEYEGCQNLVVRSMITPEWIGGLKFSAREKFLESCATDKDGNAWTPKWCEAHTREALNPPPPAILDLFMKKESA
jgi:hypothetical protein